MDDAASVILESKRKEAFVRKNVSVEEKAVSGLRISVNAFLVLFVFSAILIYLLCLHKRTALGGIYHKLPMAPNEDAIDPLD